MPVIRLFDAAAGRRRRCLVALVCLFWLSRPLYAQPFVDLNADLVPLSDGTIEWGDYDGDGDLDLLLVGNEAVKIYRNDAGTFVDLSTVQPGLPLADREVGAAGAWGDYDGDGDLDAVVTGAVQLPLYRNDDGTFVQVDAGFSKLTVGGAVSWGDYDGDGDLDLLAGSALLRNDAGTFVDTGLYFARFWWGAFDWADYDEDGDLDLAVAGEDQSFGSQPVAAFYRNEGTHFGAGWGMEVLRGGSLEWGDYDNDGDPDLLHSGTGSASNLTYVYRNDGGTKTTVNLGVTRSYRGSVAWGDYDNDGDLDFVLTGTDKNYKAVTQIYDNDAGTFRYAPFDFPGSTQGRAAWGDYDADGDLDLVVVGAGNGLARIYRNDRQGANQPPSAPSNLRTKSAGAFSATVSWDAATDERMPAAGLSYNVRIGTAPGGSDVVSAMAAADGRRYLPHVGNAGQRTTFTVQGLEPNETYYWSVQAIDHTFAGSAFAAEASFTTGGGNRPPLVQHPVPDQVLSLDQAAFQADLSGVFSDPDGDPLTYTAQSTAPAVALASVDGSRLDVKPLATGKAVILVAARDGVHGPVETSFVVTVRATAGRDTLYVDGALGSDRYSGTRPTVQNETLGPKATLEGAFRAALSGAVTTIVAAARTYDRDESASTDVNGVRGGNDRDGIHLEGDRDIDLVVRRDHVNDRFTVPHDLTVAPTPGRVLAVRDSVAPFGRYGPTLRVEGVLTLASGTLEITASDDQAAFLETAGALRVWAGATLNARGALQCLDEVVVEPGGVVRGGLTLPGGTLRNSGTIVLERQVSSIQQGEIVDAPFEQSRIVIENREGGVIDLTNDETHIEGPGILDNAGVLRKTSGRIVDDTRGQGSRVSMNLLNRGRVEAVGGKLALYRVRTGSGAVFLPSEESALEFRKPIVLVEDASIEGPGHAVFVWNYGLDSMHVLAGKYDVGGISQLYEVTFPPVARIVHLGQQVQMNGTVRIQTQEPLSVPSLRVEGRLELTPDLEVEVLRSTGTVAGTGDFTVSRTWQWAGGSLEGKGVARLLGTLTTDYSSKTLDRVLELAPGATAVLSTGALNGNGRLHIRRDATFRLVGSPLGAGLTVENEGLLQIDAYQPVVIEGTVVNDGILDLGTGSGGAGRSEAIRFTGTFRHNEGGIIRGSGVLDVSEADFTNAGIIRPGVPPSPPEHVPPGRLEIRGAYRPTGTAVLDLDLADRVDVAGTAAPGGTLQVTGEETCPPAIGTTYPLLRYTARTDTFDTVVLPRLAGAGGAADRRWLSLAYGDSAMTLVVAGRNAAPAAAIDTLAFEVNETRDVAADTLLANDRDADGDWLRLVAFAPYSERGARMAGSFSGLPCWHYATAVQYRAAPGFQGIDAFWYVVEDGYGARDTARVVVLVGTGVGVEAGDVPDAFVLHGNYPNPFNPSTRVVFDLPVAAEVSVTLLDVSGRAVLTTPYRSYPAGRARTFDVQAGALGSGTYLYRLTARYGGAVHVRSGKLMLLK